MVPPKKKRKVPATTATTTDAVMTDAAGAATTKQPPVVTMAALDKVLDQFVESLEDTSEANNSNSNRCLLDLKSLQRTAGASLATLQSTLEQRHAGLERHHTTLANLQYEEGHWTSKIGDLQASSKTPQLEALCREELNDTNASAEAVMAEYFKPHCDITDTTATHTHTHHQPMMNVLQNEIHQRGTLERDLTLKHKELQSVTLIEKKRAQFLNQLPDKLKDIEKASAPLQRWFNVQQQQQQAAANNNNDSSTIVPPTGLSHHVTHTSSDREARLQLASSLPGPLYTLLVQLQSYVDDYYPQQHNSNSNSNNNSMQLDIVTTKNNITNNKTSTIIWNDPSPKAVVWQIPIPSVATSTSTTSSTSTTKSKLLSIKFSYFEDLHVVTANVTGGDDKLLDLSSVLQLNSHDVGDYQPPTKVVATGEDDDDDEDKDDTTDTTTTAKKKNSPYGKPYLWCNYLAGLQLLQGRHPQEQLRSSTRVIVATLLRQLRANATLTYLIHKVLPSHPRVSALPPLMVTSSSAPQQQCLAKVTSFQLDKDANSNSSSNNDNNNTQKTYKMTCKRGNHSLHATVQITPSQYPVGAPPQWSLTGNTLQWGQDHGSQDALKAQSADTTSDIPPLHQARLAAMEARVNDMDGLVHELMKQQQEESLKQTATTPSISNTKKEEAVDESYYYDWILTHQLREILLEWDDWVSGNDNGNQDAGNGRSVRGRDRAKVE